MNKSRVETSPGALARVAGVLYLISIVVGIFDEAFGQRQHRGGGGCNSYSRQPQVNGVSVATRHRW